MKNICKLVVLALLLISAFPQAGTAALDPHGLSPAADMTFLPHLTGLRNKVYKNQYGQKKHLSEAIILRGSSIKEGKATVQPGGLFYISETSHDARPLMRDPFLVLGEHAYLVDIESKKRVFKNFSLKKGERKFLGDTGHRVMYEGRSVVHDYWLHLLEENEISKQMVKVDWEEWR
ncbi:hypothetical protein [Halodesulfovibrio sp.]|jgi:hypothetical protein|uniref:hypothetical protein n=1 Tax=Halodesulfovibrio sp. TaxID=1912772 RepID=UPI0025E0F286|nr:hypothetical protein [Halodesulfovibrio sp.]MCT4535169.1 hypothetical protein [Halodesulfovibrio sp.]